MTGRIQQHHLQESGAMAASCKFVKIGYIKVYDLNAIYSMVIALLSSDRGVDVNNVFSYELASVPTAIFVKDGMRICKAKSKLKMSLQIEVSRRNAGDEDATVIDWSALLWTVHWPADGSVADFIVNVKKRIASYLTNSDVYLIFDRYHEYSINTLREMAERPELLGNIICYGKQSCLHRRLSCLLLKTRNS